ncbi:hypothetical protein ABZV67_45085 [Streptomyces sp. NPDC005065]|uniref:hypothetical protein n=1 Tax=Streptomyces sp. NPDC005065 TaxID=3154461 RepID=UPI0033A95816
MTELDRTVSEGQAADGMAELDRTVNDDQADATAEPDRTEGRGDQAEDAAAGSSGSGGTEPDDPPPAVDLTDLA